MMNLYKHDDFPKVEPQPENIPVALKQELTWAVWKAESRQGLPGKFNKAPCHPVTGLKMGANNPANFGTFEQAEKALHSGKWSGFGPVLAGNGIVGIDIDDFRGNLNSELKAWLREAQAAGAYCEVSPSGTGLRLFARAKLPGAGKKVGALEIYDTARFLTMTGHLAKGFGTELIEGQELVDSFLEMLGGSDQAEVAATTIVTAGQEADSAQVEQLVEKVSAAKPNLWAGNWQGVQSLDMVIDGFPSQSEADFAMCGHIAREAVRIGVADNQLANTIMAVFEQSGLYRPKKRRTVENHAIPKVVSGVLAEKAQTVVVAQVGVGENPLHDYMQELNAQYAWIEHQAAIYRLAHRDFIQTERFNTQYANRTITIQTRNGEKNPSISYLWLRDPERRQHREIVTRPGAAAITSDNCLNDWAGFTVEPLAGDVRPFLQLFEYLFDSERYPLHWLGHLIQHPGEKMFVALVVWSRAEGVGKNLLFETVGELFSRHHYALFGQSEVDDDFCGWIPGTVFGIGDEIRASKNARSQDRLKLWQTATTLRTHDKGQPKRDVENLMNLVFLSNHADGMFLSDHDRRFYVHEVKAGPLPESIKTAFLAWRRNGGLNHLLHYLLNLDLEGFDPKGRAPITDAKREMIEASRSDLDRWAIDIMSGATPLGRELATAEELTNRFCLSYPHGKAPSVSTVGKVLVKHGAYRRDNQVRRNNGQKVRALALRRQEFWKEQPESCWRDELENPL